MPKLTPIDLDALDITVKADFGYRDAESPDEVNFGDTAPARATRQFLVEPWNLRHEFVKYMLGDVAINTDTTPHSLSRLSPQRHPLFNSLWATRCLSLRGFKQAPTKPAAGAGTRVYDLDEYDEEGEPTTVPKKLAEYQYCVATIEYEHLKYDPWGDGEYINEEYDPEADPEYNRYTEYGDPRGSADYLQLPGMVLKFVDPDATKKPPHGTAIPYGVGKILSLEELPIIWRRVPWEVVQPDSAWYKRIYGDPADATKLPWIGTVNKSTFFGRPAGTVLLSAPPQPTRRPGPIPTTWEADILFPFQYDPNGWNKKYFWNTDPVGTNNGFYLCTKSGTHYATGSIPDGEALYNERDFDWLFKVGEGP